jgi:hypothetical protein
MKKIFGLIIVLMAAMPLFAQDDGGGGGGAFAGGGGNQVFTRIDAVNPLEPVKAFLQSKVGISLSADQEKVLRPQVEASFQQLRDLAAAQQGQRQGPPAGGGERRGRGNRGAAADPNSLAGLTTGPAAEQFKKINDDLMGKITAALKPDQQAAFKKYLNSELKKNGGFDALKVNMEEAGAPLTAEQEPQIQAFYKEDAQQRAQLMRESQGKPDPAKLSDLEKTTMGKVVKLLTPAQRKALLDSRAKAQ